MGSAILVVGSYIYIVGCLYDLSPVTGFLKLDLSNIHSAVRGLMVKKTTQKFEQPHPTFLQLVVE